MTSLSQKLRRRPGAAPGCDRAAASSLTPTIYHEPWWLAASSGGDYREATVETGGRLVGRLPYVSLRRANMHTAIVMPAMTHVLGPATEGGPSRQLSITRDLIAQLPPASHAWFRLHPGLTSTLAFDDAGYHNGVDFTVRIAPAAAETIWRQMRDKTRNVIRRAEENLEVVEWRDPDRFLDFYERNLRAKGRRNVYDRSVCAAVVGGAVARGRGRVWVAADALGEPKAAIFTIWDAAAEYYHMSTRSPDSTNGATSVLLWHAIQHAAGLGVQFDMDGVNTRTNLLFVTGFGGTMMPRFLVCRSSASFRAALWGKRLLGT